MITHVSIVKGFMHIKHFLNEDGLPFSLLQLKNRSVNTVNFIEYYAIYQAINPIWKGIIRLKLNSPERVDNFIAMITAIK